MSVLHGSAFAALPLVPYPRSVRETGAFTASTGTTYRVDKSLPAEGYRLSVSEKGVAIASADEAGRFYAEQTLRQLRLPDGRLPCVEIEDVPAFKWRGVHFDDCRHFFGKETVKHVLDQMARHKFNVLHWHLTDDQGWRIDVPGYPELVRVGSVRKSSPVHGSVIRSGIVDPQDQEQDGCRYGPFYYTEADLREIVAYAAARQITVVPEIESPGHVCAALASYPEFACEPSRFADRQPQCIWGGFPDSLCVGNDAAVKFVEDVLDYVCRIFPAPYVHIGGDECSSEQWEKCPKCRARITSERLGDVKGLHPWITRRIVKFLADRGKRAIGWEEYLKGDVPQDAVGMYWFCWKGTERMDYLTGGWEALEKGHEMVMVTAAYTYFYLGQGLDDAFQYGQSGRAYGGGKLNLEKTYRFDLFAGVPQKHRRQILGGQCCNWSEFTWNQYDFDWKMWPRGCAMAEVLWLGDEKPAYADFLARMKVHRRRLIAEGVNCAPLDDEEPAADGRIPPAIFEPGSTVLFQGDSITHGGRGGDMNHFMGHGYQAEIAMRYLAYRPEDGIRFANRGVSGDQTTKILARWKRDGVSFGATENCYGRTVGLPDAKKGEAIPLRADYFSLLTGTNELGLPTEKYDANLREIVRLAKEANPYVKFVFCEPFRGVSYPIPSLYRQQACVARLAAELDAPCVPFQKMYNEDCWRQKASWPYWVWDATHPTYAGHMKMADLWIKTVSEHYAATRRNRCLVPQGAFDDRGYDWFDRHTKIIEGQGRLRPALVLVGDGTLQGVAGPDGCRTLDVAYGGDRVQNVLFRLAHGELDNVDPELAALCVGAENLKDGDSASDVADGVLAVVARLREKLPRAKILLGSLADGGRGAEVNALLRLVLKNDARTTIVTGGTREAVMSAVAAALPKRTVVRVASPDGRNEIRLFSQPLAYEVWRDGKVVVEKSAIDLLLDGRPLSSARAEPKLVTRDASGFEPSPVYKKARLDLTMKSTFVDFGDWGVALAARDDGVAWRFETKRPGLVTVNDEKTTVVLPHPTNRCHVNFTNDFGWEETLNVSMPAGEVRTAESGARRMVYLPFVYEAAGTSVAVMESDVRDYPVWNLTRGEGGGGRFGSLFARYPRKTANVDFSLKGKRFDRPMRRMPAVSLEDHLVRTSGTRTFPWRVFALADTPSGLCAADIVNALAPAPEPGADFSWVKPGLAAWEWWSGCNLEGVAFKPGRNTATYEYFVDFAARNGIPYVLIDAGWSAGLDIWGFNPNVDLRRIVSRADEKGVGIILWLAWAQAYRQEDRVTAHFARLGAKGVKVDFIDRGDADAIAFLERFAAACARERLIVDFHGASRPTGLQRRYPNVLNYEGVHGLESIKWSSTNVRYPENDVRCCFTRMLAGPMDYTPGAMDNYPPGAYAAPAGSPGSVGTRAKQMALLALYEAPLQMLCDSPTKYERNAECLKFMAATPTVWADTKGLGGTPETFCALARRAKDGSWYAAAVNNATPRDFALDTAFLGAGDWRAEVFCDVPESATNATACAHERRTVRAGDKVDFKLAPCGGFVVRFDASR